MADSIGSGFPNTGINKGHLFFDQDEGALWEYINGPPRIVSSWKLLSGKFNEQPDTSLWGEAQAGAMWIFGGVYYGWDGVQIIQITNGAPVSLYNYRNNIMLQDEFISGVTSSGTIGVLGWFSAGGTGVTIGNVEANRIGLFQKSTSAVANTVAHLLLSGTQSQIPITAIYTNVWITKLNNNDGDTIYRVGLTSGGTLNPTVSNGVFFEKAAADTNWFLVTVLGGVAMRTDSGIAVDTNWHNFKIVHNVAPVDSYAFWLDGVLVGTITTNLPNGAIQPFIHIVNTTANAKTFDVDYFEITITGFSRL